MKFESTAQPLAHSWDGRSIMCRAEARHMLQFVMGIALDLFFSYREARAPPTNNNHEGKSLANKSNQSREFNCLACRNL